MATGWVIASAAGSVGSAGALISALLYARRYGYRADPRLRARTFPRPDGKVGLEVRIEIRSVGLNMLRVRGGKWIPMLEVYQLFPSSEVGDKPHYQRRLVLKRPVRVLGHQVAAPGESIRCTELLALNAPPAHLAGWLVAFAWDMRRPFPRWTVWRLREEVFLKVRGRPQTQQPLHWWKKWLS